MVIGRLFDVIRCASLEAVRWLISLLVPAERKSKPNTTVITCLFDAISRGNLGEVHDLLEGIDCVDLDAIRGDWERTLLHQACKYGKLEIVKYLIEEREAKVNSVDIDGETPLLQTFCEINPNALTTITKIVELLLANGADVNIKSNTDTTALHEVCCFRRYSGVIQVLLNHEQISTHKIC